MPTRTASAVWEGDLRSGKGKMRLGSGAFEGAYTFQSRFEEGSGTNPEELAAAAHAGCFSMALSHGLAQAGHTPTRVSTLAKVHFEKKPEGFRIPLIELVTEAVVPGIDEKGFQEQAEAAKKGCPISNLFTGAEIRLAATLLK
jgi:osmotically inducible protein OsmC